MYAKFSNDFICLNYGIFGIYHIGMKWNTGIWNPITSRQKWQASWLYKWRYRAVREDISWKDK